MSQSKDLPRDLQNFADALDAQTEDVRELIHYALVMLLVEDGKAEIIDRRIVDGREELTIRTIAIEIFTIMKPTLSEELLEELRRGALAIMREDKRTQTDD